MLFTKGHLDANSSLDFLCHKERSRLESMLVYSTVQDQFQERVFEEKKENFCNSENEFLL